jgi:hypothetical protein
VQAVEVPEIQPRAFGKGLHSYRRLAMPSGTWIRSVSKYTSFCWR